MAGPRGHKKEMGEGGKACYGWGGEQAGKGSPAWFSSGCRDCFFEGSALQLCRHGALVTGTRPALSPPKTCGLLLCRWRQEAVPEEEGVGGEEERRRGGRKCSSRDQPPLPTSHCARDKTRARLSSHAHAHTDDPVASSLLALPRKPALPSLPGAQRLSKLRPQPRDNTEGEERRWISLLSPLPARAEAPHPPP